MKNHLLALALALSGAFGFFYVGAEFGKATKACPACTVCKDRALAKIPRWPQKEQDEFLSGCLETSKGKYRYCECALDFTMDDYPSLRVFNTVLKEAGVTEEILKTLRACNEAERRRRQRDGTATDQSR